MKLRNHINTIAALALFFTCGCSLKRAVADEGFDIRIPKIDAQGRFWIYGSATGATELPFIPHGFMPAAAAQMIKLDLESTDHPYPESPADKSPRCASISVTWAHPNWCGVAWIAGPDGFWGEENKGWYYDLSKLKKKRLVFHARGATGNERIQVKLGVMGDKKYGDSNRFPIESRWFQLKPEWAEYDLDLSGASEKQLQRITNGFTFVLNLQQQVGQPTTTRFFLDAIYLE